MIGSVVLTLLKLVKLTNWKPAGCYCCSLISRHAFMRKSFGCRFQWLRVR